MRGGALDLFGQLVGQGHGFHRARPGCEGREGVRRMVAELGNLLGREIHELRLGRLAVEVDDGFRPGERGGREQQRIHQGIHRGVHPDAQREREQRDEGEARGLEQGAEGVFHEGEAGDGKPGAGRVTENPMGREAWTGESSRVCRSPVHARWSGLDCCRSGFTPRSERGAAHASRRKAAPTRERHDRCIWFVDESAQMSRSLPRGSLLSFGKLRPVCTSYNKLRSKFGVYPVSRLHLFGPQGFERIDPGRAAGRQPASKGGHAARSSEMPP